MYDLIIKNGTILDGTGSDSYCADIAIQNGKIARIAPNLADGKEVIDATGLTVTPGFIDSHSHADSAVLFYPEQIEKVEQGITTSIGGQCGSSLRLSAKTVQPIPLRITAIPQPSIRPWVPFWRRSKTSP